MSRRFMMASALPILVLILLSVLFVMPNATIEAGGCDFYRTGSLGDGAQAKINVPNVGNNMIVVEVSGDPKAKYRVTIDGHRSTGTLNDDGDSKRVSRAFPNDEGTVTVRVTSRSGNIRYAVSTTNCGDVDGGIGGGLPSNYDGRASSYGTFGAAYIDDTGIYVYRIGADSQGYLAASATAEELASIPDCPTENLPIAVSEDGRFGIYRLTTCEYQVNIGPDDEGKVEVLVFSSLDASEEDIRRSEFFLTP